jgi:two-component system sensor kinase FixL
LGAAIASSAVHRLSQPIAAMSNYASAAVRLRQQKRLGATELQDILACIEACAVKAGEGLNELRALIRHRNQPKVPVDLDQAVDYCLEFLKERSERLGIAVERRYGTALPRPLGDPIELSHVLIQLVTNALEALAGMEPAQRTLSVGTSHDRQAGVVRIEIADSRGSVHPDLERQVLGPLPPERPDAAAIGLYIARAIVDNYQGSIRMKKGGHGGLRLCVELPIAPEAAA